MPNIRRTFPGTSRVEEEDDDDDDSDDDDSDDEDTGGGATTTTAPYRGGGKQFGKSLRPTADAADDDDEDDDDDDDKQGRPQFAVRGSGKQLAGAGKYLRPSHDDESDDEKEAPQVVKYQPASRPGGGKNILRMSQPQNDDEDEDEDDSDEEVAAPAPATVQYRVMGRGGGKSLSRMAEPESEEEEDDDDDEVEVVSAPAPVQKVSAVPHGKQMSRPPTAPTTTTAPTNIVRGPSGGKQLSRPAVVAAPVDPPLPASTITRGPSGGKQLRRPDDAPATAVVAAAAPSGSIVARSPAGGKILRRPDDDEPAAPVAATIPPVAATAASVVTRSPSGGKQLRAPAEAAPAAAKKPVIGRSPAGGKQLRGAVKDDSDEDEDDDISFGDDDDDEDFEEKAPAKKKPAPRPKRAAATRKRKAVVEESEEEEVFGDDDVSDDDDVPLDISNTEALIKDEKDRKYLDSLPELEREVILGERFEKLKEKQDMQKAIAEAKRKEQEKSGTSEPKNKRKAPPAPVAKAKSKKTAGDEQLAKKLAGTRSSARSRDVSGTKSKKAAALAALKRERKIQQDMEESSDGSDIGFDDDDDDSDEEYNEDDGAKRWRDRAKGATAKTSSRDDKDDGSDMDIDDGDDDEKPAKRSGGAAMVDARQVDAAELEDFIKVTIPRRRLARWCNEPFFDAAVLECFVRLFIGEDEKGEKVYRLCEIVDVKVDSKKSYKFPVTDKSEQPVSTNKVLRLRFSNNEKEFPMYLVSDTPPTELDVQKYSTTQKNNRAECLTKRRAAKLRRTQDHLVSTYTYTTEDIERNLQQRKMLGKSKANLGSEQTRAAIAVQGAKGALQEAERRLVEAKKALMEFSGSNHEEHDLEKAVEACKRAVNDAKKELDVKTEEEQATLSAAKNRNMKLTGRAKDQNWAKVNQRALEMNQKVDRESYKVQKEADARKAAGEKEKFNPYARRKVKPKILWEVGQAKDEDDDKSEEKKDSDGPTSGGGHAKDLLSTTPSLIPEATKTTALTESHQFTIDEEGLALTASSATGQRMGLTNRVRNGLALSEYFDRKEQGTL